MLGMPASATAQSNCPVCPAVPQVQPGTKQYRQLFRNRLEVGLKPSQQEVGGCWPRRHQAAVDQPGWQP
jgi:hypothetical protein